MAHCLPCLLKNYEVQCYWCDKGYCRSCFARDPNTGAKDCSGIGDKVGSAWEGERHSYQFFDAQK